MALRDDQLIVNAVRELLGMRDLYYDPSNPKERDGRGGYGYFKYESALRAADPACSKCGGYGRRNGDFGEVRCECTKGSKHGD